MKVCKIELDMKDVKGLTAEELTDRICEKCDIDKDDKTARSTIMREAEKVVEQAESEPEDSPTLGVTTEDPRVRTLVRHIRRKYPSILEDRNAIVKIDDFEFEVSPIGTIEYELPSIIYEDYGYDGIRPYFEALKKAYKMESERLDRLLEAARDSGDIDVMFLGFNIYSQRLVTMGQVIYCFDDFAEFIEDYEKELKCECTCCCDE